MIKLAKLPDRTPIKIPVTVNAALHRALLNYADIYTLTYSEIITIQDLIPFILASFLESDRAFTKAMKKASCETTPSKRVPKKNRVNGHSETVSPLLNV